MAKAAKKAAPKRTARKATSRAGKVEVVKNVDKELEQISKEQRERDAHLEEMRVARAAGLTF